jgi:hypothetical protein
MAYNELSTFLTHGPGADRNPVYVAALRKLLGLGPEAPGVAASQEDTEDAARELGLLKTDADKYNDEMVREETDTAKQVHDMSMAQDPRTVEFRQRQRAEKADEALGVAKATAYGSATGKNEAAIAPSGELAADEALRHSVEEKQAAYAAKFGAAGGMGGGTSDVIKNLAEAKRQDPSYPVPADLQDAVTVYMAQGGNLSPKITNQTRRTQEIAQSFLPHMEKTLAAGKILNDKGWFGPIASRARETASNLGITGLMDIGGGKTGELSAAFQSALDTLKTGIMNAHVGVRGASSPQLSAMWDQVLNPHGDWPTFVGQMTALQSLLREYASGKRVAASSKDDAGSTVLEDALRELSGAQLDMFTK